MSSSVALQTPGGRCAPPAPAGPGAPGPVVSGAESTDRGAASRRPPSVSPLFGRVDPVQTGGRRGGRDHLREGCAPTTLADPGAPGPVAPGTPRTLVRLWRASGTRAQARNRVGGRCTLDTPAAPGVPGAAAPDGSSTRRPPPCGSTRRMGHPAKTDPPQFPLSKGGG